MNKIALTILTVLTTIISSQGQTSIWTLDDCIDYALQNDLTLKQFDLDKKVSKKQIMSQYGALLPSAEFNANHNYNFGSNINPSSNARVSEDNQSGDFSLAGNIRLFDWSNFVRIKKAKLSRDKIQYDLEAQQNELIIQLTQAFYKAQYDKEKVDVIKNQMNNTQKLLKITKKEVVEGVKSKSHLYDMEADFTNRELQKIEAENNYKLSYLQLQNILNVTDSIVFTMPSISNKTKKLTKSLEELYQKGVTIRPEIKSRKIQQEIQKKTLQENRSSYLPTLNASYSYSTFYTKTLEGIYMNNTPFSTQFNNNKSKSIGASISVPIFNRLQTKANCQIAKIDLEKADLALELEKQQYYEKLKVARQKTDNSYLKWQSSKKNLAAQKQSFARVQRRLKAGLIDTISYFTSKNGLLDSEYSMLLAKYEYHYNASLIKYYTTSIVNR